MMVRGMDRAAAARPSRMKSLKSLKSLIVAAAFVLGGALMSSGPAEAVPISKGSQIDIVGVVDVQNSNFEPGGLLIFEGDGLVNIATGDFAGLMGSSATMSNLTFTPPEQVWSVGGFTFTAESYFDFDSAIPGRAFKSTGFISGNGFEPTPGILALSTQSTSPSQVNASFSSSTISTIPLPASVLMLFGALGGLAVLGRRRST